MRLNEDITLPTPAFTTEHIETVKVGTNELVAEDPELLKQSMQKLLKGEWKKAGIPDRWDGRSAERIVQILAE